MKELAQVKGLSNMEGKKTESRICKIGGFLNKHMGLLTVIVLLGVTLTGIVSATATSSADTLWQTIAGLVQTWVTRLGGVVMFVGGIMFGLGWKNEDAEQKSRGVSTIISGAIVIAVAALTSTFFA